MRKPELEFINHILVIDDEEGIRFGIKDFLESHNLKVDEADGCRSGERMFRSTQPDCILVDYRLPDGTALDFIKRIKTIDPEVPVIFLTGHGSIDLAVKAMQGGAEHFLTKPIEMPALLVILNRVLENRRRRKKELANRYGRQRGAGSPFLGQSPAIRNLEEQAKKILAWGRPVLILGETGCGKGVLARWIHENGPWADEPFVDFNCAALSKDLLESELFGYEKGAFTGATGSKAGLLEVAHGGTVFLDEIGDLDLSVQPKLLKVLEEKQFRRLGDVRTRRVEIHLTAATHQNLDDLVRKGRFRSDLYYRINTFPIPVPSLKDRPEDIPLISRYFLKELSVEMGREPVEITPAAEKRLQAYPWPGNIRELRNFLERMLLLNEGPLLNAGDINLPTSIKFGEGGPPSAREMEKILDVEKAHIEKILREEGGHVIRASRRLGIPRSSLYHKIKKFGINASGS